MVDSHSLPYSTSALYLTICDFTSKNPFPHPTTTKVSRYRVELLAAEVRHLAACSLAA